MGIIEALYTMYPGVNNSDLFEAEDGHEYEGE
jgi:hypothetical protein